MRVLLLFRGAPGCGKSTFIEKNGLKPYTISADDIRLLCQSPELDINGYPKISQKNDVTTWSVLNKILEVRMRNGDFTVIDATNSKTVEMNKYKELAKKYRYRIYIIDMTDLPIDECKRRNASRTELKQVPDEVIDKMYSRFETQSIPSGIKALKPQELNTIWWYPVDFSQYKQVHIIGDVHGCYTALLLYIGNIKDDHMYVFVGDYIDRGIENAETMHYLYELSKLPNVWFCEGNHERWLHDYGNGTVAKSKEFEFVTKPQLINGNFTKQMAREFYRRLTQCCYFTFHGDEFLITHGGLSKMPTNLTQIATKQMIFGVGDYEDSEAVAKSFARNSAPYEHQIHGHRNITDVKIDEYGTRTFNLEGKVEFGGCLRCLEIVNSDDGILFNPVYTQNPVFKEPEPVAENVDMSVYELVQKMRENRYIDEKKFGRISSFNFGKKAFKDWNWTKEINRARGLYIDTANYKIVARAYDKFFAVEEVRETTASSLQRNLIFPLIAYRKENGFLGIVSWNEEINDLLITSKSNISSAHTEYLKDMFYAKYNEETINKIKEYIKKHDVSFVFECCDIKNDPHIIEYGENNLYLLDIVKNQIEFEKLPYEELSKLAYAFGMKVKEKAYTLNSWQEFTDWFKEIGSKDWKYNGEYIEGFVVEDTSGFMFKIKLQYYKMWKHLRKVAQDTIKYGNIKYTGSLLTPLENKFFGWCKQKYSLTDEEKEQLPRDICSLRKMFFEDLSQN